MNHPPEPVALQPLCSGYRGLPDEVEMAPVRDPPKDFVLWSLFNTIFLNYFCCLGFLALVFSIKARDRKMVADLEGAQHYANTAKAFNITVTVLLVLCVIAAAVYIGIRIRTGVNLLNMLDGI